MLEQNIVAGETYRLDEAARYIGMSPQFLRRAHRLGTSPERIRLGKVILFTKKSLDAYLQSHVEVSGAHASK